MPGKHLAAAAIFLIVLGVAQGEAPAARPRARDLGLKVGVLPRGPLDAIADVAGVAVGQATIVRDSRKIPTSIC